MALESFIKQPSEEFPVWGSILDVQEASETVVLAASTVVAIDKDGNDVTSSVLDSATKALGSDPDGSYTDNMLGVKVQNGTEEASPYKITFEMHTSAGNIWEKDVRMKIKEY